MSRRTVYNPHNSLLLIILSAILFLVVGLILVGVVSLSFLDVGLSPTLTALMLAATFLGGFINIPIMRLNTNVPIVEDEFVSLFGITFRVPRVEYGKRTTIIAVNVGGALVPTLVASYLLYRVPSAALWSLIGTAFVAFVTHILAKPVKGVGIVTPFIVPPIAAAFVAYLLPSGAPRVVAYVSGVLGTLIGADLSNLRSIASLGAPVASIGGAGTFDGVFLTGIIAVLLV